MKLANQLLLAPMATAAIVLAAGQLDAWMLHNDAANAQQQHASERQVLQDLSEVQQQLAAMHAGTYRLMTIIGSLDDAQIKAHRSGLATEAASIGEQLQAVVRLHEGSEASKGFAAAADLLPTLQKQLDKAVDLASMDPNTGVAAMVRADQSFKSVIDTARTASKALAVELSAKSAAKAERTQALHWLLVLGTCLAAAAAITGSWWMQRRIVRDLSQASEAAHQVALGQLNVALRTDRQDELGQLMRAVNAMAQQLRASILEVRQAADVIHQSSVEVSGGNANLSQRTENTASHLQATAASVQQIVSTVTHAAQAMHRANQLAVSAADVAQRGGHVVTQVVSTMDGIEAASRKIADIISVIDGIAFQTNILALNAAVEAARAGEQGRGFAVVASEVRSLAQRSANAAREIKQLIGSSVEQVAAGSQLVQDAGRTMTEIVSSVQHVANIIGEVSSSTDEQSQGLERINSAVLELDRATQQNSVLVEQSAAAAQGLQQQSERLGTVVARFELNAA